MAKRELTLIPPQLVSDLQDIFPQETIKQGETLEDAHARRGIQYLINWLRIRSEAQMEAMSNPAATAALDGLFRDDDGDQPGLTVEMETFP